MFPPMSSGCTNYIAVAKLEGKVSFRSFTLMQLYSYIIFQPKGVVTNYGEGGATKREGGGT